MVGRPCYEALRGEREGGGPFECPRASALARVGHAVPSYDMRIETRAGGKRWVNVSVLGVDSEEGTYLIHLLRDAQREHETLEMARDLVRSLLGREGFALPKG